MRDDLMDDSGKILLIEDDKQIRLSLLESLELEGFAVLEAENGKMGLEILAENTKISLILLDLQMPVMDGYEFLEKIQKESDYRKIPVVIVSAHLPPDRISGICHAIQKPFEIEHLMSTVESMRLQ